jgi:dihydrodipicolinate synthase/N-acetylneuraminate lyase
MKTSPVTTADLQRSVISVPPLCRDDDLGLDAAENARLVDHLANGGVTTLMYGGNANFYNVGVTEYPAILEMLEEIAGEDAWVIPSCGPDFGKLMDQAAILKHTDFPTAMVLPLVFPKTSAGVEAGIRAFVEAAGKPAIAYIKGDGYLDPDQLAGLLDEGIVCAVKYARVLEDPAKDTYLEELTKVADTGRIISGIGERPVIAHWRSFGLRAFTSGSVCVAPFASTEILRCLQAGDIAIAEKIRAAFLPLEDLRDEISPLCVLHKAVDLAGIAKTGPLLPMLSDMVGAAGKTEELRRVSKALLAYNEETRVAA